MTAANAEIRTFVIHIAEYGSYDALMTTNFDDNLAIRAFMLLTNVCKCGGPAFYCTVDDNPL